MSNNDTIFVFFKANKQFNLDEIPSKLQWQWIGSGGTPNINYPSEMQFMGKIVYF